jgi:hypothetical protein
MDPGMTQHTEDPLDAALRKLTQWQPVPTITEAVVPYAHGTVVIVEHAPLLQQLDVAAAGAMGSHAGTVAAGLDSTRLPGNWAAIQLRDEIARDLERWGVDRAGLLRHTWDMKHAWQRGHLPDARWIRLQNIVRGWADRIEALFDPPVTVPMEAACPRCGERWGEEPAHGDRIDALAVLYHRDGDDVQKVRAVCRNPACGAVWDGRDGIRALMDAVAVHERHGVLPYALEPEQWADIAVLEREVTQV